MSGLTNNAKGTLGRQTVPRGLLTVKLISKPPSIVSLVSTILCQETIFLIYFFLSRV